MPDDDTWLYKITVFQIFLFCLWSMAHTHCWPFKFVLYWKWAFKNHKNQTNK